MADLTGIQAGQTVKIVGNDATGAETNPVNADVSGNLMVIDPSIGTNGGTATAKSTLVAGKETVSGTMVPILVDATGRLVMSPTGGSASNLPGFSSASVLNLSVGAVLTSPAWPAIKPIVYYTVPTGKTFRMLGISYRTSTASTYVTVYQRKLLWKFAIATANPTAPTLVAKTITGSGLTLLAAYRYKIVGISHVGSTMGSTETLVTLTTTQNAVTVSWAAVTGVSHYEIHRTAAGGATNTQKLVGLTGALTFTDVAPDSELDATVVPPAANTTAGNSDGIAYAAGMGAMTTVIDTQSAITAPTAIDVIYRNVYGEREYLTVTPGAAIGAQVELLIPGKTDIANNSRISRSGSKQFVDIAITDILSIGNLPVTGGFAIYGLTPILVCASEIGSRWETTLLSNAMTFAAGEEIVLGISSNAAVATGVRQDLTLIGVLE